MAETASGFEHLPLGPSLALALEEAALAIGRLDARISCSLQARSWMTRAAWTGYARALQLQGIEIDEIDVFSWASGLPLPGRPRRQSSSGEFEGFAPWFAELHDAERGQWRDRLPFTPVASPGTPILLRALGLCHTYARRDGSMAPWLALPGILRGLGLTRSPLPCLVGGAKTFRWRATLSEEIVRPILRGLTDAAEAGLDRIITMEGDRLKVASALRREHRPGSLIRLAALSSLRPLLSPQMVAEALDLTLGGAGKLLTRAASVELLVEVTGRRAWRLYLPPDLAVSFGLAAPRRGRPPRTSVDLFPDRDLADTLDAFDREMAEFDKRLGALALPQATQR